MGYHQACLALGKQEENSHMHQDQQSELKHLMVQCAAYVLIPIMLNARITAHT